MSGDKDAAQKRTIFGDIRRFKAENSRNPAALQRGKSGVDIRKSFDRKINAVLW